MMILVHSSNKMYVVDLLVRAAVKFTEWESDRVAETDKTDTEKDRERKTDRVTWSGG